VSEEPDEVGCIVVEKNDVDSNTVAIPMMDAPKIEKGKQNSEMDYSDQMKL
jgi:subtilase family serine protease